MSSLTNRYIICFLLVDFDLHLLNFSQTRAPFGGTIILHPLKTPKNNMFFQFEEAPPSFAEGHHLKTRKNDKEFNLLKTKYFESEKALKNAIDRIDTE